MYYNHIIAEVFCIQRIFHIVFADVKEEENNMIANKAQEKVIETINGQLIVIA